MAFVYARIIRFQETDAAGVVYFANLLALCHEAYEASLAEAGVNLRQFFSSAGEMAVPIAHATVDFCQPLHCGDAIAITLTPRQLSPQSFEISYVITAQAPDRTPDQATEHVPEQAPDQTSKVTSSRPIAQAVTRHVCISLRDRRRQVLTSALVDWIENLENPEESIDAAGLEAADD
jgi:1,4-dihydroxy-2-naphthoyl-CoA hydrolase